MVEKTHKTTPGRARLRGAVPWCAEAVPCVELYLVCIISYVPGIIRSIKPGTRYRYSRHVCCLRIKTVVSTQRHHCTQSLCWFMLERYKLCGHRLWNRANQTVAINQGKASEVLAYRVREHNKTSQTITKRRTRKKEQRKNKKQKKTAGVLKNVMQEGRKGKERKGCNCQQNTIRTEEEHVPVARTKQHEEDNCCFTDTNNTKRKRIPA